MRVPIHTALGLLVLLILLLGPVGGGATALAEDDDGPALTVRLYPTNALTEGRRWFGRGVEPIVSPDMVSDEERPLFGFEGEEPWLSFGTIDELIELAKGAVVPEFWEETEGVDIAAIDGHTLAVIATEEIHEGVARFLAGLERSVGAVVTLDVRCVRVPPGDLGPASGGSDPLVLPSAAANALLGGPGAGPAVTLTSFAGIRSTVYDGVQQSFLADHDVEVAQGSNTSDPIVTVSNLGLAVNALTVLDAKQREAIIELDAALAHLVDPRSIQTDRNGPLDVPAYDVTVVQSTLRAPLGAWVVAGGRGAADGAPGWAFLVRARARTPQSTPGLSRVVDLGMLRPGKPSDHRLQYHDVRDLTIAVRDIAGRDINLWPSNYTPPEPPELPDPQQIVYAETLVDLARITCGSPEDWEDPASIEARNGVLIVRNAPEIQTGIERMLGLLRDKSFWTGVVTGEMYETSAAVADGLPVGAGRQELEAALEAGSATLVDRVRVISFRGARNTVRTGREVSYIQDYEVEIAQDSSIGNPIVWNVLAGVQLDAKVSMTSDGGAAQVELRFTKTQLPSTLPVRRTNHGDIELPRMPIQRVHTTLMLPVGGSTVAGVWGEGDRRRVLLLTLQVR